MVLYTVDKKRGAKMFIKIKADAIDDHSMDEAIINTDQISWINLKDRSIRFADGSFLYLSNTEINKVIMATTEKIVILKDMYGPFTDI